MLYSEDEGEVFLGRQVTQHKNLSDATAKLIDDAIKKLIDNNYDRAYKMLTENMDILHLMANSLMKYETIDSKQIDEIMDRKEPSAPEGWVDEEDDDTPVAPTPKSSDSSETNIGGEATEL
jgi:cell division protease FtsH